MWPGVPPHQTAQPPAELTPGLAGRRALRRMLRVVALVVCIGLAFALALYLSTPHEPFSLRSLLPRRQPPQVKTTAVANEPGTVDLQVQRGRSTKTFRFSRQGKDWSIQDVTPARGAKTQPPRSRPESAAPTDGTAPPGS